MRTTTRATLATVVAALVLTGCGGDPEPRIADPSPSPTTETSGAEEPTPPELPAAAGVDSRSGAEAFALHWWDVANYAQATGDTEALARISSPDCEACQGAIKFVDQIYKRDGTVSGGENSVRVMDVTPAFAGDDRLFDVQFTNRNDAQRIDYPSGKDDRFSAGTTSGRFVLAWVEGGWRVDLWEIE